MTTMTMVSKLVSRVVFPGTRAKVTVARAKASIVKLNNPQVQVRSPGARIIVKVPAVVTVMIPQVSQVVEGGAAPSPAAGFDILWFDPDTSGTGSTDPNDRIMRLVK